MIKNVCIAGGGSAGWITALLVKAYQPNKEIHVIENEEIGILGVGEATTPAFMQFLEIVGISIKEIIDYADGTIKSTIKFTNWNNEGEKDVFYHPFSVEKSLNVRSLEDVKFFGHASALLAALYSGDDLKKVDFTGVLNEQHKVPFVLDSTNQYVQRGDFALHFDARKVAEYFKKVGISRGVKVINKKIIGGEYNEDKKITHIKFDDATSLATDFVFDCTGLARIFIGNTYKSEWRDASTNLINNCALGFNRPIVFKDVEPCTEARAMSCGWVWNIPLQSRYGCGYVHNDAYITEDQARQEILDFYGSEVKFTKKFRFNPGYYKTPWVNNCVAVGLASGFMEPLESTSIWLTIISAVEAIKNFDALERQNQDEIDSFNQLFSFYMEDVITFLSAHYLNSRVDTQYWVDAKNKSLTPKMSMLKNKMVTTIPNERDFLGSLFSVVGWTYILAGTKQISSDAVKSYFNSNNYQESVLVKYARLKNLISAAANVGLSHTEYVNSIKNESATSI